jgi:hypothetical protein
MLYSNITFNLKFMQVFFRRQSILSGPSAADLSRSLRLIVKAGERSGASQEALTMSKSGIGCEGTDGEDARKEIWEWNK